MTSPTGAQCIAPAHPSLLTKHCVHRCHLLASLISAEQLAKVLDRQGQAKYYHVRKIYDQVQAASRFPTLIPDLNFHRAVAFMLMNILLAKQVPA